MAGFYVDGIEICDIPIGKDEVEGSPVWVLYREWLSGQKRAEKIDRQIGKKHQILHESGREKSKSRFD